MVDQADCRQIEHKLFEAYEAMNFNDCDRLVHALSPSALRAWYAGFLLNPERVWQAQLRRANSGLDVAELPWDQSTGLRYLMEWQCQQNERYQVRGLALGGLSRSFTTVDLILRVFSVDDDRFPIDAFNRHRTIAAIREEGTWRLAVDVNAPWPLPGIDDSALMYEILDYDPDTTVQVDIRTIDDVQDSQVASLEETARTIGRIANVSARNAQGSTLMRLETTIQRIVAPATESVLVSLLNTGTVRHAWITEIADPNP